MEEQAKWYTYRTLRKIGGSITVALPQEVIKEHNLKGGQRVKLEYSGLTITIVPLKKESTS